MIILGHELLRAGADYLPQPLPQAEGAYVGLRKLYCEAEEKSSINALLPVDSDAFPSENGGVQPPNQSRLLSLLNYVILSEAIAESKDLAEHPARWF